MTLLFYSLHYKLQCNIVAQAQDPPNLQESRAARVFGVGQGSWENGKSKGNDQHLDSTPITYNHCLVESIESGWRCGLLGLGFGIGL